ncbi:MAG TPA: UDP-N-acetylmuramoyl-tripeptide--D-alanyl-D-alanine ligase [Acidimicrobiales bacterium]
MELTTADVAEATGGEVFGRETVVSGASIDTRTLRRGQLFVPIVDERDGHDFIGAAVHAGAAAYLTAGPIEAGVAIRVADTRAALLELGRLARSRLAAQVVGVTGSVGKTTTKDLLAAVLGSTFLTAASKASFNNELGVPLTLLEAADDASAAVIEMGARGVGHIAMLCEVARPTIGVVTVVAGSHLESFGSLDGVATGKAELVEALPAHGTAVLNADDHRVAAMAARTEARVVTFGRGPADVQATDVVLDDDLRTRFTVHTPWGDAPVHLGVRGEHQVMNALAALAAGLVAEVPLAAAVDALASGPVSAHRMHLSTAPGGARILNDAYNANPTSMRAALDALAALPAARRIAVVGTMAEMGESGAASHAEIAHEAQDRGIRVIAVAEPAYGPEVEAVPDVAAAIEALADLGDGDAVLVKASRVAGLEAVAAALLASPAS